jgi:hypothetical protein
VIKIDDPKAISKWTKERIWTEAIEREGKSIKEWEEKYSFLAEYDPRVSFFFCLRSHIILVALILVFGKIYRAIKRSRRNCPIE